MAGRNKKTSIIKDIDEMESTKEESKVIEEPVEEVIKIEPEPEETESYSKPAVRLKKVQANPWLNIRNKPSMNGSEIIGRVENGDTVEIFAIKDNFAKISETEEKWVCTDFLFPVYNV